MSTNQMLTIAVTSNLKSRSALRQRQSKTRDPTVRLHRPRRGRVLRSQLGQARLQDRELDPVFDGERRGCNGRGAPLSARTPFAAVAGRQTTRTTNGTTTANPGNIHS